MEVLQDTDFGAQLPGLFNDARDRLEIGSFTTGSGTNEPLGYVTALGTGVGTTGTQTTGTVSTSGAFAIYETLDPRWRQSGSCAVLASLQVIDQLRQTQLFTNSTMPILQGNTLQVGNGVPVYENSASTTATASASSVWVVGDWQQHIIVDRVGISILYEPLVTTGASVPTGQQGWFAFWRSGTTLTTTGAGYGPFRGLKVS